MDDEQPLALPGLGDLLKGRSVEQALLWVLDCTTCGLYSRERMRVAAQLFRLYQQQQAVTSKATLAAIGIGGALAGLVLGAIIWRRK
jgi:hypothetical protein